MVSNFRRANITAIRQAVDAHNDDCPDSIRAISLNPIDHGLLRVDILWGIPVLPDDSVRVKRIRIDCGDHEEDADRQEDGHPVETGPLLLQPAH